MGRGCKLRCIPQHCAWIILSLPWLAWMRQAMLPCGCPPGFHHTHPCRWWYQTVMSIPKTVCSLVNCLCAHVGEKGISHHAFLACYSQSCLGEGIAVGMDGRSPMSFLLNSTQPPYGNWNYLGKGQIGAAHSLRGLNGKQGWKFCLHIPWLSIKQLLVVVISSS